MAENSGIEWTDHTFNPWIGCTKVSPACDHCYAEAWDARWGNSWGPHTRRRTSAANWRKPLAWDKAAQATGTRARVFCASLADVFDNDRSITSGWRGDLWHLIHRTPHLDWLLLTKRPQNIARYLRPEEYGDLPEWGDGWPNVWLGTTAENQVEADRRIPHLLRVPARVRFLSCEPLLGELDLNSHLWGPARLCDDCPRGGDCDCGRKPITLRESRLHWVIVGGESGTNARPMHPAWARSLRDQCVDAGIPFFFKQWGNFAPCETHPPGAAPIACVDIEGKVLAGIEAVAGGKEPVEMMCNFGKTRSGRLLDGRAWDEAPGEAHQGWCPHGVTP